MQYKNILVVEDEELISAVLKEFLEACGHRVTIVADGLDILSEVLGGDYDLITMDLRLPGLEGLEATELIRLKHGLRIPVIVIAGDIKADERRELEGLGVEHFIRKEQLNLEELRDLIDQILTPHR